MLLGGPDGACAPERYVRELRSSGGLRTPAATGNGLARHFAGAGVTEIGLLRASTRVREVDPHHCALRLVDFLAAIVANQPRNTCHGFLLE
jgi:hypothetical protein